MSDTPKNPQDTQQPPMAEPDKGAASPVAPTGTEPEDKPEPPEEEKNPLVNSNVLNPNQAEPKE